MHTGEDSGSHTVEAWKVLDYSFLLEEAGNLGGFSNGTTQLNIDYNTLLWDRQFRQSHPLLNSNEERESYVNRRRNTPSPLEDTTMLLEHHTKFDIAEFLKKTSIRTSDRKVCDLYK